MAHIRTAGFRLNKGGSSARTCIFALWQRSEQQERDQRSRGESRSDVPDLAIRDTTPPHIVVRGSTFVTGVSALHELKVSCHTSGTLIPVTT